uniref:helix-turn-helix domain-containing protein n=1 Tax=Caviibacter abscessus TaxID=1766719 RepID=UPI0038B35A31
MSIRKIATALHSSPSTISREIKRNSCTSKNVHASFTKYFPILANNKYRCRRHLSKRNNNLMSVH